LLLPTTTTTTTHKDVDPSTQIENCITAVFEEHKEEMGKICHILFVLYLFISFKNFFFFKEKKSDA